MKTNLSKILLIKSLMENKFRLIEYHLVSSSPWPFLVRVITINSILSLILWFNFLINVSNILIRRFILFIIRLCWWRDVNREASLEGVHPSLVYNFISFGILLFILREIFFFVRFFWGFFFFFKGGDVFILGGVWPPKTFPLFNPRYIPLINSLLLLRSGGCLTLRHFKIVNLRLSKANLWIYITLLLGFLFTSIQIIEYFESPVTIIDSRFGSIFFTRTGFHGLHVIIGTGFLSFTLIRIKKGLLRSEEHSGFNNSAWYWHFVDVVWLFLYISFYWLIY